MRDVLCAALLALLLCACSSTYQVQKPYGVLDPASPETTGPPEPPKPTDLTKPVALISDTQLHESRGVASRWFSMAGDQLVDVTIRPGQEVIGMADILQFAIEKAREYPLVIHAGDALDVSCETEWKSFTRVFDQTMKQGPGPTSWLFAPGNHDGYLTGNIFPLAKDPIYIQDYWANMCNAGRQFKANKKQRFSIMPKERIVEEYVQRLGAPRSRTGNYEGCTATKDLCWSARAASKEPWTSYLVQVVRLPAEKEGSTPIYAVLLDSSDYDKQPIISVDDVAGVRGGLSLRQLEAANAMVKRLPQDARYFLVAHHPSERWRGEIWSDAQIQAWQRLMTEDERSLRFLVSSHTHEGALWNRTDTLGVFWELNTGSLADAPVYIRSLKFNIDALGTVGFVSRSLPLRSEEAGCNDIQLPKPKEGYEYPVKEQMPKYKSFLYRLWKAADYTLNYNRAKHTELRPQLLAYADVVDVSMPANSVISWDWTTKHTGVETKKLYGRDDVAAALRENANCHSGAGRCSYQAKGELLRVVDEYYWESAPPEVKDLAHKARLCMALDAARDGVPEYKIEASKEVIKRALGEPEWTERLREYPALSSSR